MRLAPTAVRTPYTYQAKDVERKEGLRDSLVRSSLLSLLWPGAKGRRRWRRRKRRRRRRIRRRSARHKNEEEKGNTHACNFPSPFFAILLRSSSAAEGEGRKYNGGGKSQLSFGI